MVAVVESSRARPGRTKSWGSWQVAGNWSPAVMLRFGVATVVSRSQRCADADDVAYDQK